jgi:hypothetical protein
MKKIRGVFVFTLMLLSTLPSRSLEQRENSHLQQNKLIEPLTSLNLIAQSSSTPYPKGTGFEVLPGRCNAKYSSIVIQDWIEQSIKRNLEDYQAPINSPFTANIFVENGYPVLRVVLHPLPDRVGIYYAEQAMWDIEPQLLEYLPNTTFTIKVCKTSGAPKGYVSFHLIPLAAVKKYSLAKLTELEISSPDNVKSISVKKLQDRRLKELREERYEFFKSHDSETRRESIFAFREHLTKTYEGLFEKKEIAIKATSQ